VLSKAAQLSKTLANAGFVNIAAVRQRADRAYHPPPESRGSFRKHTDSRAGGHICHKFEVQADSREDAIKRTVPDALIGLSTNKQMVTAVWIERHDWSRSARAACRP